MEKMQVEMQKEKWEKEVISMHGVQQIAAE